MPRKSLRLCDKGHNYYKSSDCPACPVCESERKPNGGFLSLLASPARRALENAGISTLRQLANYSEEELLKLHGIGKTAIPKLRKALEDESLHFKKVSV